jgi:antitoxin HigA-1
MDMLKTLKSSETAKKADLLPIPTVGEILLEEFLKTLSLSQNALARALSVPPRRINEIVLGKRSVTADTDLRHTRYFRLSEGFFLRLQMEHDIRVERRVLGKKLDEIKPRAA